MSHCSQHWTGGAPVANFPLANACLSSADCCHPSYLAPQISHDLSTPPPPMLLMVFHPAPHQILYCINSAEISLLEKSAVTKRKRCQFSLIYTFSKFAFHYKHISSHCYGIKSMSSEKPFSTAGIKQKSSWEIYDKPFSFTFKYRMCFLLFSDRKHDIHVRIKNVTKKNDSIYFYFEIKSVKTELIIFSQV